MPALNFPLILKGVPALSKFQVADPAPNTWFKEIVIENVDSLIEVEKDSTITAKTKVSAKSSEELEKMTVNELRSLARKLKLPTMTNKQIKFERKDKLVKEILCFYQRRDN